MKLRSGWMWPLLPLVLGLLLVEALVQRGIVASYLLPAPSQVAVVLWSDRVELLGALGTTALASLLGFLASALLGFVASLLLSVFPLMRKMFLPYAVFFQTVPVVAIAPVLVIWFGYGLPSVVACSFIVSIFPVIANSLVGLLSVDPGHQELFRLYRVSRLTELRKLAIPSSLPYVMAGLRIAAGLAVIGTVVGEFISGTGLGSVIDVAKTQYRVDKVFACVLLASFLGWAAFATLNWVSRRLLGHWHSSELSR
ncbi:MAG: ABC transporter permease [Bdellovibrionales bacterium]|nr:ABC transporter permease [Bdellovibrionales bacterium]